MTPDCQFPPAAAVRRPCFEVRMTAESTTSLRKDRIPWAAMAGIIATVTVFAVAPLLSFILERQGTTPGLIGPSAAMTPLVFIVSYRIVSYPLPSFRRWRGAWARRGCQVKAQGFPRRRMPSHHGEGAFQHSSRFGALRRAGFVASKNQTSQHQRKRSNQRRLEAAFHLPRLRAG